MTVTERPNAAALEALSKVPAVTLGFWIIKILATTLGETGGDTVSMTMDLGYLIGSAIFLGLLILLVAWQIAAKRSLNCHLTEPWPWRTYLTRIC